MSDEQDYLEEEEEFIYLEEEEEEDEFEDGGEDDQELLGGNCGGCGGKFVKLLREHHVLFHLGRRGDCNICKCKPGFHHLKDHIKRNHSAEFGLYRDFPQNQVEKKTGQQLKEKLVNWGAVLPNNDDEVSVKDYWLAVKDQEGHPVSKYVVYTVKKPVITDELKVLREALTFKRDEDVNWTQLYHAALSDRDLTFGHKMPAANCDDEDMLRDSFKFTNCSPQLFTFNVGILKGFEIFERQLAEVNDEVTCITGDIYDENSVTRLVPGCLELKLCSFTFKILVIENEELDEPVFQCFKIPHVAFGEYWMYSRTTVEAIEEAAGIRIFNAGPKTYSWDTESTHYYCQKCKKYVAKSSFREHIKIHDAEFFCKVDHCPRDFSSLEELRAHPRDHHNLLICELEECCFATKSADVLGEHLRRHGLNRPYACLTCGDRFTARRSLNAHELEQHEDGKDLLCPLKDTPLKCSAKYSVKRELHLHLFTHTPNLNPYYCEENGCTDQKGFAKKSNLKRHLTRTHDYSKSDAKEKVDDLTLDEPLRKLWRLSPFAELQRDTETEDSNQ